MQNYDPAPDLAVRIDQIVGPSPLTYLPDPFPQPVPVRLYLKRDELLHPTVSGNKWRKLKYNLIEANRLGFKRIVTFGGAYSNHLYATAAAGHLFGFETVGVVRGDELAGSPDCNKPLNATLQFCRDHGMTLHFVSRTDYRRAAEPAYLAQLQEQFGPCYILPEGGTNNLAIHGTAEIMPEIVAQMGHNPDVVACAVGTGGTLAGMVESTSPTVSVVGVLAIKLADGEPLHLPGLPQSLPPNVTIQRNYSFRGYARTTPELLDFMQAFEAKNSILLDPVYTAKLLFAIYDLAQKGGFPDEATVVAVHTGGLQGRVSE
ncbi:1-aminocyclopropane-1-carboxylate deaminase/D-cysteine desulfhydrase [Fibrella sp. HMF5335]|uniref:1-aminocyclopropane-1-carboxylate deaminase/D-cysteine desulfhydrase n=1 Tax=Fibrella rubiginis TaxID=2817060 RepID=A0A939GLL1_9BACT|nr:pyridoxal-phosphate dependent enzyme [Fibrella rubiginis]MBO0939060.1 1-aminocyclopropane-1-carboxylate deaminase/D-cysteine desulfhydrase [Fibrella rubiginis]